MQASCRSGSEIIRHSTTSVTHDINPLVKVMIIIGIQELLTSKKLVKKVDARHLLSDCLVGIDTIITPPSSPSFQRRYWTEIRR